MSRQGGDRTFFGHPRGLGVLAGTEAWIAFSFYGMQSLLMLYMTGTLLQPGHVDQVLGLGGLRAALALLYGKQGGEPLAAAITGLYTALIFATPLAGGLLADRLLGRTRTIVLGAVLMTIGHFLMAFEASFLVALACLVCGAGCAGSTKAQVGALYGPDDRRRASAFQIYTIGANLAVILAPLVCGTLGERVAWRWGFGAAGVGMLLGLVVYLAGCGALPPERPTPRRHGHVKRPKLTGSERRRLAVLVLLLPVLAVAASGTMGMFNAYLVWARANYALVFLGRTLPVSWLLSLDAIIGTAMLLLSVLFWRCWARWRPEPDEIDKMAWGAAISAAAPLILAAACRQAAGHKIGLGWAVAFHLAGGLGFASLYAVGLALYCRAAPAALGTTVVNGFALHLFLSSLLAGWLGGLLGQMSGERFWLLQAGLIAAAAAMLVLFGRLCRDELAPSPQSISRRAR